MKRKIIIGAICAALAGGYWMYAVRGSDAGVIRIGVIAPLTGPAASLGEFMREGVRMAVEDADAAGSIRGKKIELSTEDDGCTGTGGVGAYRKLRASGVRYIVGPLCGASRVPVLAAAEHDDGIILTTGLALVTAPATEAHTFNVLPSASAVADAIVRYAAGKEGHRSLSLLYPGDEYGEENRIAIMEAAESLGVVVPNIEKYMRGASDLRTQVLKFESDRSDGIIVVAYGPDYAVFLKQARELGLKKPIFAVSNLQTPEAATANHETEQRIAYSYPAASDSPSVGSFVSAYRARHAGAGAFVPMYVGSGYDAFTMLVAALKECGDAPGCVNARFKAVREYPGANGPITFDARGNNSTPNGIEIRVLEKGIFSRI